MAFLSLHDMSRAARTGSVRQKTTATKALLSITQAYYAKNNTTILTIRLTEKALENARMQVGDRVDVAFDPENNLWQVALVNDGSNRGYAISGAKNSARGQIRFTYYEPMPLIAATKTRKANAFSKDNEMIFNPGQIIFKLDEEKTITHELEEITA